MSNMKTGASLPALARTTNSPPAGVAAHGRAIDDDDDFTIAVTNQTRHDRSKWTQLYKKSINDTFVHEDFHAFKKNIGPLLQRFETIDPFRRSRKRFTVGENLLPKLQKENRLRRDAVLALSRPRTHGLELSFIKEEGVSATKLAIARIPFDRDKWSHNARCEYCCKDGGDLACSLCNVLAHTTCYLTAWKEIKQRYPTSFNNDSKWICIACEEDLQMEYDQAIAAKRHSALKRKETSCALLISGYTRMVKEARLFTRKRECAIRIQARIRGKLARNAFNEMQRLRIRPYVVELVRLHGLGGSCDGDATGSVCQDDDGETRLQNGFLCNPYIVFHIVEDHDDEAQRFCFESEIQRGSDDVTWNEEIFVPGVNGNVTMCFTVLSKNGPNNFFLGQGAVRLNGTEIWRYGANLELKLKSELEIIPRIGHHQLMRIQDIGSVDKELTLSIRIRHFSEIGSYCGYMQSINTVDSVKGNSRWCVLADGTFRIYRHYGLTLAFETLKMMHASEVQLLQGYNHHHKTLTKKPTIVFIQHEQRTYLLTAECNKTNTVWVKKLQMAMKHKY